MDRYKITVHDGSLTINCAGSDLERTLTWITETFGGRSITIERV